MKLDGPLQLPDGLLHLVAAHRRVSRGEQSLTAAHLRQTWEINAPSAERARAAVCHVAARSRAGVLLCAARGPWRSRWRACCSLERC